MIWAEVDKLGWFINTVTEPVLEKEKQVVKNEKYVLQVEVVKVLLMSGMMCRTISI